MDDKTIYDGRDHLAEATVQPLKQATIGPTLKAQHNKTHDEMTRFLNSESFFPEADTRPFLRAHLIETGEDPNR
ncbi:MAG: hypothetical protein KAG97_08765, partial [Victivallales bacterium]|nr:hypothetical protein [Victivallales bacterium]